jgi:Nucleotide modification associated domain 3
MARIYLINVGANTAHSSKARAPLFPDGQFVFIPFPDEDGSDAYGPDARPFVCDPESLRTHPDPDWRNLTYGDNCHNRRAKALLSVQAEDILLFWGLFWKVGWGADIFDIEHGERLWCLFGGLTVTHAVKAERGREVAISEFVKDKATLDRAIKNAHVYNGKLPSITSDRHDVLFIGDSARSALFSRALDFEIYQDDGLLQKTILSKHQRSLQWDKSPRWNSSLRSCRSVLDLSQQGERARAQQLRSAILEASPGFDILSLANKGV